VISYKEKKQSLSFELEPLDTGKRLEIILPLKYRTRDNETGERVFDLLNQAEISFDQKDLIYRLVQKERRIPALLAELGGRGIGREVAEAVAEAAKDGPYLSKDDFRQRTKASKTVIDYMAKMGLFGDLPESNQLSLFDL